MSHQRPERPAQCQLPRRFGARRSSERGYVLVTVVVTLFLIATIAVLQSRGSAFSANTASAELDASRAEYVAQAGMQHALWLAQNNACTGDVTIGATPLGAGSYAATLSGAAAGTAYTLTVDQDAWIRSDDVTKNNNSDAHHIRFESGNIEQALYRFDLSALPAGARINAATAWFFLKSGKTHPEGPITLHRITADWTETGVTWEALGGRFEAAALGRISAQSQDGTWVRVNLTAQVQAWANGQPNYGILFNSTAEGIHTEYVSREGAANEQPYLEVVVGSGPASPIAIEANGTLTNGVTRSLSRPATTAYQPAVSQTYTPGPDQGEDAEIFDQEADTNNADAAVTRVSSASDDTTRTLLRFDLGGIPAGAKILGATLSLERQSGSGTDQPVAAHRIVNAWSEGSVTWNRRTTFTNWTTAGGDFDAVPVATTPVGSTNQRYEWDITSLVQGWAEGSYPNYGVALVAAIDGMAGERFYTSDESAIDRRPGLSVTYACECGTACMSPQASGRVMLVIDNVFAPTAYDTTRRETFESWGYDVNYFDDDSWQSIFDSGFGSHDLVYVAGSASATKLGDKLTNAPIGVVTEQGEMNTEFGLASGYSNPVGNSITVNDASHFITSVFAPGELDIYEHRMQQLTASGTTAPAGNVLATIGGADTLVVMDGGATMQGGGTTAERRVLLPMGANKLGWNHLTNAGELVVQRAMAWAMSADGGSSGAVLLVVANDASLTSQETAKQALIESWGYTAIVIDDDANQSEFDAAFATVDVAYVAEDVNSVSLGTKLREATIGVVIEEQKLPDEFGLSSSDTVFVESSIDVTDNSHYITQPFSLGTVTFANSAQAVGGYNGTLAPGLQTLAVRPSTSTGTLVLIEAGGALYDTGTAAGRRVKVPWGDDDFDINSLTADGQTIMQRAIEWGSRSLDLSPFAHWKLDESSGTTAVDSIGGNDGTLMGAPVWTTGNIDGGLAIDYADGEDYVEVVSATGLDNVQEGDYTLIAWFRPDSTPPGASSDNDANYGILIKRGWHTGLFYTNQNRFAAWQYLDGDINIDTTSGNTFSPGSFYHVVVSIDRAAGLQSLYVNGQLEATGSFTPGAAAREYGTEPWRIGIASPGASSWGWAADGVVDDVRIYDRALSATEVTALYAAGGGGDALTGFYLDEFNAVAYSGNDGTLDWGNDWQELGESNGPASSRVSVVSSASQCASGGCLLIGGDEVSLTGRGVSRAADLAGAPSAELSFTVADSGSGASVDLDISDDSGSTWTTIQTYSIGSAISSTPTPQSFDISGYATSGTQIRFVGSGTPDDAAHLYIDDVRIDITGGGAGDASLCPADVVPDTLDSEFSTSALGISDPWGVTYLPPGTTFSGVNAPVDGAWLVVDGSKREFVMTDMSGASLASTAIPASEPRGVAHLSFGAWSDHLAVASPGEMRVYFLDMGGAAQGWVSTVGITERPVGVAFIATSAGGTLDGHIAISADKDATGSSSAGIYILDQAGTLQSSIDLSGFAVEPWGIAHVPYRDKFLVADKSGSIYVVAFDGTLVDQYDAAAFGATQLQSVAINGQTGARALLDKDSQKLKQLTSSTCSGGDGTCNGNFRDNFDTRVWSGSNGSLTWSTDWIGIGENDGPTAGDIQVMTDQSNYQVRIRDNDNGGEGIEREVDLSGAATATLDYEYRRMGLDSASDYVSVEVSTNGASGPWTELTRHDGSGNDSVYQPANHDITPFMSAATRIRFVTSATMGGTDTVWFDNVEITCSP